MAKNGNRKKDDKKNSVGLKTQTKHGILGIVFFVLALFFLMSAFNMTGVAGVFMKDFFKYLLGSIGYFILPILLVLLGTSYMKSETPNVGWIALISGAMFLLSSLGIINITSGVSSGGLLGKILSTPFVALFDRYASIIFLGAILIISILALFDTKLELELLFKKFLELFKKKPLVSVLNQNEIKEVEKSVPEENTETTGEKIKNALGMKSAVKNKEEEKDEEIQIKKSKRVQSGLPSTYVPPPLSLLEEDQGKPNTGDIKANANIIKRTLLNFGIEVE
ncbi:MAG TPA: DNA translocase FtsK 4TM domain-containing protein, partial [Candidatus Paceibacterota bacterium]|nr:DNA translocase FtsK 4TM domain-containing protein [Candidatus Paceibacterota bacterium]